MTGEVWCGENGVDMYAKIFSQIFDSSIAEDYEVRHVFEDLLKLADMEGVVDMTMEAIARRTNVPFEKVRRGIEKLMESDPGSRSKEAEGRRLVPLDSNRGWGWIIVNYTHYRSLLDEESRRKYFRDAKRKQREGGPRKRRGVIIIKGRSVAAGERDYVKALKGGASEGELERIVESTLPREEKEGKEEHAHDTDKFLDTGGVAGGEVPPANGV